VLRQELPAGVTMTTIETNRTTFRKVLILAWCAVGLLLLSGLLLVFGGFRSGPIVTGIVRLDGQLLPKGWIRFVPDDGTTGPDGGAAIRQGKYSIPKGLALGKYKVEIQGMRVVPNKKMRDSVFGSLVDAEEPIVFEEFNRIREVGPGRNTHDFDLKEARKRQ
jgi:hypothetical protein